MILKRIKIILKVICKQSLLIATIIALMLYPKERKKVREATDSFAESDVEVNHSFIKTIKIIINQLAYRISYEEYFIYRFEERSRSGKKRYVGEKEWEDIYYSIEEDGNPDVFKDKKRTYDYFKKYYGREVLCSSDITLDSFKTFCDTHLSYIVKPQRSNSGQGIEIIQTGNTQEIKTSYEYIMNKAPCVIEELIDQDESMASFHPSSINTIRITSYIDQDHVIILQAVIRMGRGKSIVDNAGAGGIYAVIDSITGIVRTLAYDEKGQEYLLHPDTKKTIIGYQIPKWGELISLVEHLARVLPEQKLVGWDLALTKKYGWVMVEGNTKPVFQLFEPTRGLRKEVEYLT